MSAGRGPVSLIGRAASAVRRHFADPTYYSRRFRASRLGGTPAASTPDPADTAASGSGARLHASLRAYLRRLAERPSSPSAFDRWTARPDVFIPAVLIGSTAVLATLDTPRTAPFTSTLIPVGGAVLAWTGLLGAGSYAERRWPRAERLLLGGAILFSVAVFVAGFVLARRAVSIVLMQISSLSMYYIFGAWRRGRAGDGQT